MNRPAAGASAGADEGRPSGASFIRSVQITGFKSIAQLELSLSPGLTCIVGPNGAGVGSLRVHSFTQLCGGVID